MLKRTAFSLGVVSVLSVSVGTALAVAGAAAAGEDKRKPVVIEGVSYADHRVKDVRNASRLELEADDYYFSPIFLRGNPGQKLTLVVESEGRMLHNITIAPRHRQRHPAQGQAAIRRDVSGLGRPGLLL